MYVVDASVVLKWFLQEDDSPKALDLYAKALGDEVELAAPDILLYEVANILVRKRKASRGQAENAVRLVLDSGLNVSEPDHDPLSDSIRIAAAAGLTVYDASYVALAAQMSGTLITADLRLAELAGSLADIRLLSTCSRSST